MPNLVCLAASDSPTLAFSPADSAVVVRQGESASDVFTIKTGGSFQGDVKVTVSGLADGVGGSWSSTTVTMNSGTGSSTLILKPSLAAQVRSSGFTVTASGDGLSLSRAYPISVEQAPGVTMKLSHQSLSMQSMTSATVVVTATPIGGVTIPSGAEGCDVAITSGLPSGINASWSRPVVTGAGAVTWTLTLSGSPTAVASSGNLSLSSKVTDASSGTSYSASEAIPLNVAFTTPTLKLSPDATHVIVKQGMSASDVFSVIGGGSYHGSVKLGLSGLPNGVMGSFSNDTIAMNSDAGSSTLTLHAAAGATSNWFPFTVTATGDNLTASNSYVVEVKPLTGVQISLSQANLTMEPQTKATLSVTAIPVNGISVASGAAGSSAAILAGLPSGVSAAWSDPTLTSAGAVNWTLTLMADATPRPSSNPIDLSIQITDKSSGLVYSVNPGFTLLVSLLANVNIGTTAGQNIPSTFLGLSHEWGDAQANLMGSSETGVNAIYRQLLTNLTTYGSGPINIRIGGDSTDTRGEPSSTVVRPFAELNKALGSHFELGLNLGSGNVNLAVDQAKAYVNQMPSGSIEAMEIGNEPDEYSKNGLRPSNYTVQNYFSEFETWKENVMPVLPDGTKLMGASWAFVATMQDNIQDFESANMNALTLFSQHCYGASPSNNPADDYLLSSIAATSAPTAVATSVAATHAQGLPFRMGEMGAVSDGGMQGISDSFSAALWSIDTMFEYANVGVDGVNWFTGTGDYNSPFAFTNTVSHGIATYTLKTVNPIYYGFLFFQVALGNGAKMLPVDLNTPVNLKAWATDPTSRTPRVAIINKDEVQEGNVAITIPGYTHASVLRLQAASYKATAGVTFAGQTLDGSSNGELRGSKVVETIDSVDGVFTIPMSTASAALVIFAR